MLHGIRKREVDRDPPTVAGLLAACHERIRRFAALAIRMLEPGINDAERAAAAAEVHRYFTVALPLHVADEDHSLGPRLVRLPIPDDTRAALVAMARQHDEIESAIAALAPRWSDLAARPASWSTLAADLAAGARALARRLDEHLLLEEASVLPLLERADLLDEPARATILAEMRARRA